MPPKKGKKTVVQQKVAAKPALATSQVKAQPQYSFEFVPNVATDGSKSLFNQLRSSDGKNMSFANYDDMRQQQVFLEFDTDKSGFIDSSELELCFKKLGQTLNKQQLSKQIQLLDINHDGKISLVEFKDIFKTQTNTKPVVQPKANAPIVKNDNLGASVMTQKATIAPVVVEKKPEPKPIKVAVPKVVPKETVKIEKPKVVVKAPAAIVPKKEEKVVAAPKVVPKVISKIEKPKVVVKAPVPIAKKEEKVALKEIKEELEEGVEIFDQALYDECQKEAEMLAIDEILKGSVLEIIEGHLNAQLTLLTKDHIGDALVDIKQVEKQNKKILPVDKLIKSNVELEQSKKQGLGASSIFGVKQNNTSQLREIFNAFDLDSSGCISVSEIIEVLKRVGTTVTTEQANLMIKDVDVNKDNELDFNEFKDLVRKINNGEYGFIQQDQSKIHDNHMSQVRNTVIDNQDLEEATDIAFGIKNKPRAKTVVAKQNLAESVFVDVTRTEVDKDFENRIKQFVLKEAEEYIRIKQMEVIARNEQLLAENRRLKDSNQISGQRERELQIQLNSYQNLERRLKDENKIKLMQAIEAERLRIHTNRMSPPVREYIYSSPQPRYEVVKPVQQFQYVAPPATQYDFRSINPIAQPASIPKFEYIKPVQEQTQKFHNIGLPDYLPVRSQQVAAPVVNTSFQSHNMSYNAHVPTVQVDNMDTKSQFDHSIAAEIATKVKLDFKANNQMQANPIQAPVAVSTSFERFQDMGLDAVPGPPKEIDYTNVSYDRYSNIGVNQDSVEGRLINQFGEGKSQFDQTMALNLSKAVVSKLLSKNDLEAEEYLIYSNRFKKTFDGFDVLSNGRIQKDKMAEFVNTILRS